MAYDSFVLAAWVPGKGSYYRVFVGRFSDRAGAGRVLQEMQTRRAAPPDSRIVARSWALP
jgi:cell division septation protein DedD